MKRATHRLVLPGGVVLAQIRLYANGRTDLEMHGELHVSRSPSLCDDVLMGRWREPVRYLYGPDSDAIPNDARIEKVLAAS